MKIQLTLLTLIGFVLTACGKKGPVEPLEPSSYPHTYPKPLPDPFPTKKAVSKGCCDD